jgi:hypothetical protein
MWLVRLGTFSRYGHACEVIESQMSATQGFSRVLIVEAAPGGVVKRWARDDEFRWSTGGSIVPTPEQRARLVMRANTMIGKGYDWPSLARFIPRFFYAKYKGFTADHPDAKLFCSELVVWNRREEGIDMFPGIAPRDVSPGMLQDFCPRSPGGKP